MTHTPSTKRIQDNMPRTYSNRAARAIARCGGQKSRAELPVKTGLEIWERKTQVVGGCARGGTADAPDLGSGPARGGGSTPLARTNATDELSLVGAVVPGGNQGETAGNSNKINHLQNVQKPQNQRGQNWGC